MRQVANDYYQKQDWASAAKNYEKILEADGSNVGARYRYGVSLLGLNRNTEAQPELEKAFELSPNAIFALPLAVAYARTVRPPRKCTKHWKRVLNSGVSQPESLTVKKDFAAFQNEKRFKDLDDQFRSCGKSVQGPRRNFVNSIFGKVNGMQGAQGLTVGSSSVQLILGQCVIFENWTTPLNSGKSFEYFDAKDKKWHQTWVDDKGTHTQYVGGIEDGKMVLIADTSLSLTERRT